MRLQPLVEVKGIRLDLNRKDFSLVLDFSGRLVPGYRDRPVARNSRREMVKLTRIVGEKMKDLVLDCTMVLLYHPPAVTKQVLTMRCLDTVIGQIGL